MQRVLRVVLVIFSLSIFASIPVTSFAQQANTPKPAPAKKAPAATPAEKQAEPAIKPETPAEPKPAIREAPGDKYKCSIIILSSLYHIHQRAKLQGWSRVESAQRFQ